MDFCLQGKEPFFVFVHKPTLNYDNKETTTPLFPYKVQFSSGLFV